MTGFNHGMTGAVIALSVKRPELAVPLSFISHYAADLIPHFGFKDDKIFGRNFNLFITSDFIFALLLMAILGAMFPGHVLLVWVCMIVAAIPDLEWWFRRRSIKSGTRNFSGLSKFHNDRQRHIGHFYFDFVWFAAMWAIILSIKF